MTTVGLKRATGVAWVANCTVYLGWSSKGLQAVALVALNALARICDGIYIELILVLFYLNLTEATS